MHKVGIIGCGKIAQLRHIPEYLGRDDCELYGLYDNNTDRANELAEKYGCKVYESIDELIADEEIDLVSVCTPNYLHADVSIKAMRGGKDVLCEKPMATTLEDCIKMVEVSKETGKLLMIGMNQRLARAHVRAKQLIKKGEIGRVVSFKVNFGHGGPETWSIDPGTGSWFFDKEKGALGAMADLGVHKLDLIHFLLEDNIIEMCAKLGTLDKRYANGEFIGVDDNAMCVVKTSRLTGGAVAASWTYYGEEDNSTVLYGTEGIMKIYGNTDYAITIITKEGEKIYYDVEKIQTNDNQTKSGVIDAFVNAVNGDLSQVITGESVLPAMRATFAAVESSETNRTVFIPENEVIK